jgi:hypothetical protein
MDMAMLTSSRQAAHRQAFLQMVDKIVDQKAILKEARVLSRKLLVM